MVLGILSVVGFFYSIISVSCFFNEALDMME